MDKKDKMTFDDLVINEDQTVQGNRWQQDPSGKTQNPVTLSLLDLVSMSQPDQQYPNDVPASETPLHGSQHFTELLGDLYVQVHNVEKAIAMVKSSPVLADRPKSVAQIDKMVNKAHFLKKVIKAIANDIDKFSVEKPVE